MVGVERARAPNLILRRIREVERRESREEFAAAVVSAGRQLGNKQLACDARLVARWEDGDVGCPRPAYQRALEALIGRPFAELGFRQRNAIELPSPCELAPDRLSFHVDEEGRVWATVDRRTFLVGTSATLLAQAGLGLADGSIRGLPMSGDPPWVVPATPDPFGFAAFATERWPELRLSCPQPDYGVDFTALLPTSRPIEGAALQLQIHDAEAADGRALTTVNNLLRWEEFSRAPGRGLLIAACQSSEGPKFFALDSREAGRRAAHHDTPAVAIPDAYELDDLTFALLWACASLDTGLQVDDQELTMAVSELAPYETLPSSAVSREAAAELGAISQIWLGSDFCARHILRNLKDVPSPPVFWTREQTGGEACPWLLFEHKHAYLRATRDRFGGSSLCRMFCLPHSVVASSVPFERVLLLLAVALMEATGIHVQVCDDPSYADVEGFVLGGQDKAIIANWVRGDGIWHVDTARRPSVLSDFREATGQASAHSVIEADTPAARLQALARYLEVDWAWIQERCRSLAQVGTAGLLRPRSRHISTVGVDTACSYVGQSQVAHV
jgi:hypothetical protein